MTTYIISASLLLLIIFAYRQRGKRAKNKVVRVIDDNCTGCQRCVKKCRRKALDVVKDESSTHIVINPDKCTACRDCILVCKFSALELADRSVFSVK